MAILLNDVSTVGYYKPEEQKIYTLNTSMTTVDIQIPLNEATDNCYLFIDTTLSSAATYYFTFKKGDYAGGGDVVVAVKEGGCYLVAIETGTVKRADGTGIINLASSTGTLYGTTMKLGLFKHRSVDNN